MKHPGTVRLVMFGLLLFVIPLLLSSPSGAQIGIGISVRIGPPALPVYEQPICPGVGFLWTPGYWAWDDDGGYYWVPGTWVEAPTPGLLWTPGYWGWNDGVYLWNDGYWGPHVGFYGGINYGFGYGGVGFVGGEWRGDSFFYNTAVMNVNTTTITNVYVNKSVVVNNESHVAFNGGEGGVQARPTAQEEAFSHERHTPPVAAQTQQVHAASQNRALFASSNHGRPPVAATAKPGQFSGKGVVTAKAAGAPYRPPAISPKEARASAPAGNRSAANRPAEKGNRPAEKRAAPADNAKAANRPAPSKRTDRPESANRAESTRHENKAQPSGTRANETRPSGSHTAKESPAPKSNASKPSKESTPRAENAHPANKPRAESAPKASAPKSSPRESRPPESTAKASPTPKSAQKPAAAPRHESAPKPNESAPKASSKPPSEPKPAKPSAPPKKEKKEPPKGEPKG